MKDEYIKGVSMPQQKATLIFGDGGYSTNIALYKKPNILLRIFLRMLGCKVELLKTEAEG